MSGVFTTKAMIQSIANNRAMLKKRRLKDNPYFKVHHATKHGNANYEELKAWRLLQARKRIRWRWTVALILMVILLSTAAVLQFFS